jgi:hypothetical protein
MKFPIKNLKQLINELDNDNCFCYNDDEWNKVLVIWDQEHYDKTLDEVQELINDEVIIHEDFYDTLKDKLHKDTKFLIL